ncbi:MAG: family 2 encapsulin nanocompartment cargo protein terpene cyclase [Actinocrinis sp.]
MGTSAARLFQAARPANSGAARSASREMTAIARAATACPGAASTAARTTANSNPDSTSDTNPDTNSPSSSACVPPLYCPDALRDDPALGDAVDDRLVAWWDKEIGAQPGELEKLRACGFGRLIMLAHPDCDDPDRLAAAAKCAVAEWAVDDLYLDGDSAESEPERLGPRLAMAYAAMAPARVPPIPYTVQYELELRKDAVLRAIRSSWTDLGRYASHTQVFRLRHELAVMFVAYNQEAEWHISGRVPPVWEFLMHRWENAFCPTMVVTDPVGGYEVPPHEYFAPRVRRVFTSAGVASVLVNDLYSLSKEDRGSQFDYSLPRVLMHEEDCTLQQAVDRTARLHDDLVRYVEAESAALSAQGSPELGRFLGGVWAWMGGGKKWHATSARYHDIQAA